MEQLEEMKKKRIKGIKNGTYLGWHSTEINQWNYRFRTSDCFEYHLAYGYVLITAVIASVSIELLQLVFRIGLFETDDVINNVFGAMIGLGIYVVVKKVKNHVEGTRWG